MKARVSFLSAAVLVIAALSLTAAGASGAGNGLRLYLVNAGPDSAFYNESMGEDGNCDQFQAPSALSTSKGTDVRYDSPGYAFAPDLAPSTFSYTVPEGGGFTVPANPNAVVLKQWAFSGDGSCPEFPSSQLGDQAIDWRVSCSGPTCGSDVSLTGPGEGSVHDGWQAFAIPAGTPVNSLFNDHAGPSSAVEVGAGDVITLELTADTWAGIQWNAPQGAGASSLAILGK